MITIFDALDLKVSGKCCVEDITGPVRVVGCTGWKLELTQLCLGCGFEKTQDLQHETVKMIWYEVSGRSDFHIEVL